MIRRVLGLGFATQSRWRVAVFCHFTKVTKKEQNKIDKGKEKQKVLQKISLEGKQVKAIDFSALKEAYKQHLQKWQEEVSKIRSKRMCEELFREITAKVSGEDTPLADLGQLTIRSAKQAQLCLFDEDHIPAVQRALDEAELFQIRSKGLQFEISLQSSKSSNRTELLLRDLRSKYEQAKDSARKTRIQGQALLKDYEKVGQKDKLKLIEKELESHFSAYNAEIQKLMKEREKQIKSESGK